MSWHDSDIERLIRPGEGLVSPEIFHDRELFGIESRRVFMRTWLYVGHESQLAKRGDFISTYMGLNPVLAVRQRDGGVKVMLNACRHRGMKVCRADGGNTRAFTCTYHGWSYALDGALTSVPLEKEVYGDSLDRGGFGLVQVPRVETYKGLIFANFDETAPGLLEYLGDMAWYLDAFVDRREGGIEVLGGVHKIVHRGNWKMGAEQFAGDNYHALYTHVSAYMSWRDEGAEGDPYPLKPGFQFTSRAGHGVAGWRRNGMDDATPVPSADYDLVERYYRDTADEARNRLGAERVDGPSITAGTVFPNFSYLSRILGHNSIGVWHPRTADTFLYVRYCVVDKAAPPEVKTAIMSNMHVWPLGTADADDGENWSEISANLAGPAVRDTMLNYQMASPRRAMTTRSSRELSPSHGRRSSPSATSTGAGASSWPVMTTRPCRHRSRSWPARPRRESDRGGRVAVPETSSGRTSSDAARGPLTPVVPPVELDATPRLQLEIEQFLYMEARLLDERRLAEWYTLMADDIRYWAPTRRNRLRREADLENSRRGEVALFDDSKQTLGWRVNQILTGTHWSEDPPSRTRHLVSNVVARRTDDPDEFRVRSNFACYRNRLETETDLWAGERQDLLRCTGPSQWQVAERTILLDQNVIMSKNLSIFF